VLIRTRDENPDWTWAEVGSIVGMRFGLHVTADMARNRYVRANFDQVPAPDVGDTTEALQVALRDTRIELQNLKVIKRDQGLLVQETIATAIQGMVIPPVVLPPPPVTADSADAILLLADWQAGKKTPSYGIQTTIERVEFLVESVIRHIQLHPVPIRTLHMLMLGDLVEGDGAIFKGQAHEIDSSLFVQVFTVSNLIVNAIRKFLAVVPSVSAEGIAGNHGVVNRESHPESNADCFAMETARLILEDEPRLTFPQPLFPGHSHWQSIHEVRGLDWFLFHGDQIRSQPGTTATKAKLLGYYATMGGFDFAASAHYHSSLIQDHGAFMSFHAGSTESGNEYAREKLATGAQAGSQMLLFQDETGLTGQHIIRLP